jgi:hypothetical protein
LVLGSNPGKFFLIWFHEAVLGQALDLESPLFISAFL